MISLFQVAGFILIIYGCNDKSEPNEEKTIPSVTSDTVKFISDTRATFVLTITSTGGYDGVVYGLVISNNDTEPDVAAPFYGPVGGTGTYTFFPSCLTPGMTYYIRAYTWNAEGTAYGNVLNFTTSGDITGDPVFNPDVQYGTLTDFEGNVYRTLQIGGQEWMAENLRTTFYADSSIIPVVVDPQIWAERTTPAYSWYINDQAKYEAVYGALYNWYAVNTGKLCPAGWHVPSDMEWALLAENLAGADSVALLRERGSGHWVQSDIPGINSTGFTALPGGFRTDIKIEDQFITLGYVAAFWSSSRDLYWDPQCFGVVIVDDSAWNSYFGPSYWYGCDFRYLIDINYGLSVRCVKD